MKRRSLALVFIVFLAAAGVYFLYSKKESERALSSRIPPSEWVGRINMWNVFQWVKELNLPKSDSTSWVGQLPINPLVNPILFGGSESIFLATERSSERQFDTLYQPSAKLKNLRIYENGKYVLMGVADSSEFSRVLQQFICDSTWNTQLPDATGLFTGAWEYKNRTIPILIRESERGIQIGDGLTATDLPAFGLYIADTGWIQWTQTRLENVFSGHPYQKNKEWTSIALTVKDTAHESFNRVTYRYDNYFNKVEERITEIKIKPVIGFEGKSQDSTLRAGKLRFEPNLADLEVSFNREKWERVLHHLPVKQVQTQIPDVLSKIHIRLDANGLNGFISLADPKEGELDAIQ